MERQFDYIVAGAGSAGCAVAYRLAESEKNRVLLLEAGPKDSNPWIHLPIGYTKTYFDQSINWQFESEPHPELEGRRLYLPRGKTLGGTSSINGMVYIRGNAADYDDWAQKGCAGWDWEAVLPFFKKAEDQSRGADAFHGVGGPLRVSDQSQRWPLADAFLDACSQAGIPANPDFNGASQEGAGYYQVTMSGGRRWSAAKAYLGQAKRLRNLTIQTGAHIKRIVLDGRRATGIRYDLAGQEVEATCQREVILCAGAFGSPQILQLSGIGDAEHLKSVGLQVTHHMPSVGSNLHDHFNIFLNWRSKMPGTLNELQNSFLKRAAAGLQYALSRAGAAAGNGMYAGLFTRTNPIFERPDLQITLLAFSVASRTKTAILAHPFPGFSMMPVHLRPDGRGQVRLRSADPYDQPSVQFSYLQTDYDRQSMLAGIRLCREIVRQPALRDYVSDELSPGADIDRDDELIDYVRRSGITNSHPTSSCAMGPEGEAVVDHRLRVHGIGGLRVADASIMPSVVAGNTNAPTIMIGEKAAAMILEDARGI